MRCFSGVSTCYKVLGGFHSSRRVLARNRPSDRSNISSLSYFNLSPSIEHSLPLTLSSLQLPRTFLFIFSLGSTFVPVFYPASGPHYPNTVTPRIRSTFTRAPVHPLLGRPAVSSRTSRGPSGARGQLRVRLPVVQEARSLELGRVSAENTTLTRLGRYLGETSRSNGRERTEPRHLAESFWQRSEGLSL